MLITSSDWPQASSSPFFGVVVGRCANRIEGASFTLDGQIYKLAANNGKNALHGGTKGFDKHIWAAKSIDHADGDAVQLTRTSPDGEEVCRWSALLMLHCCCLLALPHQGLCAVLISRISNYNSLRCCSVTSNHKQLFRI